MKKRILPILLALVMAALLLPTIALADGTVEIDSSEDLVAAITKQADNQTWVFTAAGTYDAKNTAVGSDGRYTTDQITGGSSFAFPIYVDGLTIKKADGVTGDVIITSTYEAKTGNWEEQNFITVSGSNLTIENVDLKGNPSEYYDGYCNKVLELWGNARNLTIKNVELLPLNGEDGISSGSIYINTSDPGATVIENVVMYSWLNARAVESGTVTVKNLTQDFTNNVYAGYSTPEWGYAWNPGVTGAHAGITTEGYRIVVDNKSNIKDQIFNSNLRDGTTIVFTEGEYNIGAISTDKAVNLEGQGNVTLKGSIGCSSTANGATVSISNLAFENNTNYALNFTGLQNSEINVTDCTFKGSEFGIGVNSTAKNNVLTVSNSEFNNVGCAVGIKVDKDKANSVEFEDVEMNGGFAVQAFGNISGTTGYDTNAYYNTYENFVADKDNDFKKPDYNALNSTETLVTPATFASKLTSANDDDTLLLAPGTYTAPSSAITKRINLKGYGADQTVIDGTVTYKFSSDQGGKSVTVSDLTIEAGDGVQGLQFRGDNPNNGYDLKIIVEDCAFEGWTYGVTMNSHANGYDMTVRNCDFSKSLYAVSYNYDETTAGQEAKNSLTFAEGNIIAENGFAVQKFNNATTADKFVDNSYDTIENFKANKPTISGTVVYVAANADLAEAISNAPDGATIIVAPGTYDGNIQFGGKSLTIKAQYPANPETGNYPTGDLLSNFTGTFNTSEGTNDSNFDEDQVVTIDGFAFSGDGLKVGNTNYNTVGNLVVKNCTMQCGSNLVKENVENYNMYNYFVKVTGNPGAPYANVVVHHNNINGNPADLVTPIQLWDVSSATVSSNMIVAENANGHQAINISKMAENATVVVEDNLISGYSGGIYVTTWLLGGNTTTGAAEFTGSVKTHGNDMFLVDNGTPIFIGYEAESVAAGNPYGKLSIDATFENYDNTNNDEIVMAEISQMPGAAALYYTVTFMDGKNVYETVRVKADGTGTVKLFTPSKPGYIFMGWKCSDGHTYQPGEVVPVDSDMTFTAIWANMPDITPGTPGGDDEPVVPDFPFTDVREGQWFYEAVKYVYSEGIMNGMDRYTFQPNDSLTRAMVWTMLARMDGVDTEGGATWYSKAQDWAMSLDISDGTNPMGEITRQELVTMLWRYAYVCDADMTLGDDTNILSYIDIDKVSDWAVEAFQWCCGAGIIEGDENGALNPTAGCTRAEAAAMFMRLCKNVDLSPTV
jgi:uncharacterized repeat protein (TIGR02543 family)